MIPITVEWDDSQQLIILRYHASYTWEELETAVQEMNAILNSVYDDVGVIIVFNPMIKAPFANDMMSKMQNILKGIPHNISLFCTVGIGNPVTRALMNVLLKIYPTPFPVLSVGTEEEAKKALADKQTERLAS